jgi:hypothetical protein
VHSQRPIPEATVDGIEQGNTVPSKLEHVLLSSQIIQTPDILDPNLEYLLLLDDYNKHDDYIVTKTSL